MFRARSERFHNCEQITQPTLAHPRKSVWLLAALVVAMTVGCDRKPVADDPLADHSFLTQQPCAALCWYNLEPNKSSENEVYDTLKRLPFVDPATITESGAIWIGDDNAKEIGFGCSHPKEANCGGSLIISQGKLKRLMFIVPYRLTFQMAADRLGLPDYVDSRPLGTESGGCMITLIWSQKGIYLASINSRSGDQCQKIWVCFI